MKSLNSIKSLKYMFKELPWSLKKMNAKRFQVGGLSMNETA